jgi:hypothetical protein
MKNLWFAEPGDFAVIKISEQFERSDIRVCAAVGRSNGSYRIFVNGKVKATQDLYSQHDGMTNPYINLGACEPVSNAFEIRFELAGHNGNARARDGRYALGIDFFLLRNSFLER